MHCARHPVECGPDGRCALCVQEDGAGKPNVGAALLGLVAAMVLLAGGSAAYGFLGSGAPSLTKFIAAGIPAMALPTPVFREQAVARAAADPALEEGELQEVREALAKAWRAGAQDAVTEVENERTGDAATATPTPVASADPTTASTTLTANADPSDATATATASADAPAAPTTSIADASPPDPIAIATAAPSTPNTTSAPSVTGSADAAAVTAAAVVEVVAAVPTPLTVPADASPSDIHVFMYSASWCDVCKQAEAFLIRRGIPFEERDVTASPVWEQELHQLNPAGVVPTFNVDGNVKIGFDPRWLVMSVRRALLRKAQGAAP